MSSISDALKKAQHNRIGETHGAVAPPPSRPEPPRHEPPATPSAPRHSLTVPVIAVLALGLVLALVLARCRIPSDPPPNPAAAVPAVAPDPRPVPAVPADQLPIVSQVVEKVDLPAAPPAPVPPKVAEEPLPVLSGTFYSEQNPVAIIDGFALKEGETHGAFRVVKILPRGVILESGAGQVELRLK